MTSLACMSFMGYWGTHMGLSDLNLKDSALPLMNPVLFSLVDHSPALAWRRSIFSILACCRASPICAWSTMLTKTSSRSLWPGRLSLNDATASSCDSWPRPRHAAPRKLSMLAGFCSVYSV